jgi:hypothetical protein
MLPVSFRASLRYRNNDYVFQFDKVYYIDSYRYFVSIRSPAGLPFQFQMEKDFTDNWKLVDAPKVPDWIHDLKVDIISIIQKEESG